MFERHYWSGAAANATSSNYSLVLQLEDYHMDSLPNMSRPATPATQIVAGGSHRHLEVTSTISAPAQHLLAPHLSAASGQSTVGHATASMKSLEVREP